MTDKCDRLLTTLQENGEIKKDWNWLDNNHLGGRSAKEEDEEFKDMMDVKNILRVMPPLEMAKQIVRLRRQVVELEKAKE